MVVVIGVPAVTEGMEGELRATCVFFCMFDLEVIFDLFSEVFAKIRIANSCIIIHCMLGNSFK